MILKYCAWSIEFELEFDTTPLFTSLKERATKVVFLNGKSEVGLQSVMNCKKKRACELGRRLWSVISVTDNKEPFYAE